MSTATRTAGGAARCCCITRAVLVHPDTAIKDVLLAENEKTSWYPVTVKYGRYGEWLRNNVDWALSRTRYWGTPLPLWECANGM